MIEKLTAVLVAVTLVSPVVLAQDAKPAAIRSDGGLVGRIVPNKRDSDIRSDGGLVGRIVPNKRNR